MNAQAQNAQHILSYRDCTDFRPAILAFRQPNPRVASNPNVDLIRVSPNRLWPFRLMMIYLQSFDAIFYPGIHHYVDWLALRLRLLSGRRIPVISTIEGLAGIKGDDTREEEYAAIAGHPVYCDKCSDAELWRVEQIYAMSDRIIAISPFLARIAVARYGNKVSTLPLGIDAMFYRKERKPRRSRPRVLGIGTLITRKRPWVFLELGAAFPHADFVWIGEGHLRTQLIEDAKQRGLQNVSFPGAFRPEIVADECAASNIFLLPSMSEGVPKVTQEAAAAGLAQIVFGFYETPTVVDGVNGFVIWNDGELRDRLAQLIDSPDLVERMGCEGRRMAEGWRWEYIAPMWRECIAAALE